MYWSSGMAFLLRLASAGGDRKRKPKGKDEITSAVDLLEPQTECAMDISLDLLLLTFEFESTPPPP